MAQPSPPDTPQEIIDEIIDLCRRDKKTLIACSLTSRAWAYRTRKHLFSSVTLTDKSLPVWREMVAVPTPSTGSNPQSLLDSRSPPSLSSHVTSLKIVSTYSGTAPSNLGAEIFRAVPHLSAFTHVKSLTLAAVSFLAFGDDALRACLGSLSETVRELTLSFCYLDEGSSLAFRRLFNRLDLLELDGNVWVQNPTQILQKDIPTLRGSFKASEFTDSNGGFSMLDSIATAGVEYHTITLGYNEPSAIHKFNALFAKCKDHLKTLILTAPESGQHGIGPLSRPLTSLDLSPCKGLVEIHGRFYHSQFEALISILRTVGSPRFRKLSIFIAPPIPAIKPDEWARLDVAVGELAKRVQATAGSGTLEVLFSSYSTVLGGVQLSEIEGALPLISSDARVSLRTKYIPLPPTNKP